MKQAGLLRLGYEWLERILNLPADHKISDILSEDLDRRSNSIRIKVYGDKMPFEVHETEELPIVPIWDILSKNEMVMLTCINCGSHFELNEIEKALECCKSAGNASQQGI